jgi:hypothetical protein
MNTDKREILTGEARETEKVLPWDLSQSFFMWSFFDTFLAYEIILHIPQWNSPTMYQ